MRPRKVLLSKKTRNDYINITLTMGCEMGVGIDLVLIFHWHLHLVVGRRLIQYIGHVECRLIHACSFFSHDRTTCMHELVVGLTVK